MFNVVQCQSTDILYSQKRILQLLDNLKRFRAEEFHLDYLLSHVTDLLGVSEPPAKRNTLTEPGSSPYRRLYNEILDTAIMQIEVRFANFENLKFFNLFDKNKFTDFTREFPKYLLDSLFKSYPAFFNKIKLENELQVFYGDPEIFGNWEKLIDIYLFIYKNKLLNTVPEINKLLSLILSLSPTSASNERDFSCLKRIKTYARNTMKQERLTNLSSMSIEKILLKKMQKTQKFYDDIVYHFATSKNRRIELIYKNI